MREVLHLSFGPQANELNASFYNRQTEYFVYNKALIPDSHVDPNVRFHYGKEFTPRALFWEYRNGFGKWKQYNHNYEPTQSESDLSNEIQLPMDKLVVNDSTRESRTNSSWTSRVKFPIHPKSMYTIPDWEIDYNFAPFGQQRGAPDGQNLEFDTQDEGKEQFKASAIETGAGTSEDYLDLTFRPLLEKCDLLDGINIVTDLGGWSGLTGSFMETLRDDYVTRQMIFTWALSRNYPGNIRWPVQLSRITALDTLAEFSSLVLPLQDTLDERNFALNANSHLNAFETTCLLSSLRRNRVSMHQLCQDLTREIPSANIVQIDDNRLREFIEPGDKVKSTVEIWRGEPKPTAESTGPVMHGVDLLEHYRAYWCPQPETYRLKLQTNNAPLQLRKVVARASHDVRETVFDMTEPYSWGWDPDFSDDEFA